MGNSCDCPKPPGGRVVCNDTQLAICRVKDGVPEMQCVDLPKKLGAIGDPVERNAAIRAWAFKMVTGRTPSQYDLLSGALDRLLKAGIYVDPKKGTKVRFAVPDNRERTSIAGA